MKCRAVRRLRKLAGRRGVVLLIVGVGHISWGAGMIADPPGTQGLHLLTDRCPIQAWAWLWILAGVVAAASAFVKIGRDWAGFLSALAAPTVWALAYAAAAVSGDFSRGGFVAVWYLTTVGVIMWAAAVPEYSVPPPSRPQKEAR